MVINLIITKEIYRESIKCVKKAYLMGNTNYKEDINDEIIENYNDFNSYYINKMVVLEEKHEAILNNVSLVLVKEGKISRLFNNIKTLLKLNKNLENDENL